MKESSHLPMGLFIAGVPWGSGYERRRGLFNTSMTGYQEILTDPSYYLKL